MPSWFTLKLFSTVFALLLAMPLVAQTLPLTAPPQEQLMRYTRVLFESGPALGIEAIQTPQIQQQFKPGGPTVLSLGIDTQPIWVHLQLNNPQAQALTRHLIVGTPWLDHLDVFLMQHQRVVASWKTGDERVDATGLQPGIGFELAIAFPPGQSNIYLRAESADPLILPIRLRTPAQAEQDRTWVHYSYGVLYGFLIALMAYNGMLFVGLRDRIYLYYAGYLMAMIGMNLAYTGHGLSWFWPGQLVVQRYAIAGLIVLFGCSFLLFARRLLALKTQLPGMHRFMSQFSLTAMAAFAMLVALGSHRGVAALVAFFSVVLNGLMLLLALFAVIQRQASGRYFLWAVSFGILGAVVTTLTVLGWMEFSTVTFRALEIGVSLEATLLALALAAQMREHKQASVIAEHQASHDPLTGVYNRRAFLDRAHSIWSTAVRNGRPLSVIMLDLDHFKRINDTHGHAVGDQALVHSAQLLSDACRTGDVLARWGGEEFVLLLPETELAQACAFAERLRQQFVKHPIIVNLGLLAVTTSLGVAQREAHASLDELIKEADTALYQAKHRGRNQLFAAQLQDPAGFLTTME
jgi:diguanylate cyclase (GGDEF)-like protein